MNCHRARQLISPYLDQQLTGKEMLALQQHFSECASCEAERRSIRQVKTLLRALHEPRPRPDLPVMIAGRLAESDQPLWRIVNVSAAPSWPPRPARGRRLATALALSCLTVLSFAATCFAPPSREGALAGTGFFLPMGMVPTRPALGETNLALLTAAPHSDFLSLTEADRMHRERLFLSQFQTPAQMDLRLSPLPDQVSPDQVSPGYSQGDAAFAAYHTR